jgi:aminoglycoside/choline kinase family phosphotransferase
MSAFRIRTAFILGAGLGTRLRPLTDILPKPLLPVGGRPLITYAMDHCLTAGVERFIVNTHHRAEAYDQAFPERSWRGWPILFRREPVLLETAGGLRNIEDLLGENETLLVCNGDLLSDLPLSRLMEAHAAGGREVTLALRSEGPLLNVSLDASGAVCDLRGLLANHGVRRCLFTGIYCVERRFLRRLTPGKIESVVPVFAGMIREAAGSVGSVVIDEGTWEDVGDVAAYERIRAAGPALRYETGGPLPVSAPAAPLPPEAGLSGGRGKSRLSPPMPDGSPAQAAGFPPSATSPAREGAREAEAGAFARRSPGPAPADSGAATTETISPAPEIEPGDTGEDAAAFVRRMLGLADGARVEMVPVGKGGSDRDYFRVFPADRPPLVLMRYGRLRGENGYYAAISGFLDGIGVAVPAILGHDPGRGLILVEDLGDRDLFSLRDAPWEVRRGLYEKTLLLAAKMHAFPTDLLPDGLRLMPGFSPDLYRWERAYFREQCVRKACGVRQAAGEEEALEAELAALAGRLLETPPSLIHRDLQSQNVMIREGQPVLIDFQGMRFGSPFYDIASLLWDPYVPFRGKEREELLRFYAATARAAYPDEAFRELFLLAAVQRLMQALGAYCFLGIERGKPQFLPHIRPALENLIVVTAKTGRLPHLHALCLRCLGSL